MDTKYLEYILEIARQRNITRAAEALFVSQSALSQYLLRLEQEVGAPLFKRTKAELLLTPAGELYVEAAKSVIDIRQQLYQKIGALDQAGRIRLGVSSRWGMDMITRLLPDFRRQFPLVTLEIYQNKYRRLERMLADGKLDMAVTAVADPVAATGDYKLLRREEICFATPAHHHYCRSHGSGEGQLDRETFAAVFGQEDFVCSEAGSTLRQLEQELFQSLAMRPRILCEVNDNRAALGMVEKGLGVAFIPQDYLEQNAAVVGWRLSPGLYRSNILAWRPQLQAGPAEEQLMHLILSYPLFTQQG